MKKLIAIAVLLFPGMVWAGNYEGNPDRFTSIGVGLSGSGTTGTFEARASGTAATQDVTSNAGTLALDARVPISDSITLNGAVGIISSKTELTETSILPGGTSDVSGVAFGVGIRFYIK